MYIYYFVFTISLYFMHFINLSGYLAASVQIKPVTSYHYWPILRPYMQTVTLLRFIRFCVFLCYLYVHVRAETLRAEKSTRYRTSTVFDMSALSICLSVTLAYCVKTKTAIAHHSSFLTPNRPTVCCAIRSGPQSFNRNTCGVWNILIFICPIAIP